MVGLKARLRAAQDDLHAARRARERRDADCVGGTLADDDGPLEPDLLEDRRLVRLGERHEDLRHRLQAHHGGQQPLPAEDVVVQIGVGRRGQLRVHDQLDLGVVDARLLQEAQEGELGPLDFKRRHVA